MRPRQVDRSDGGQPIFDVHPLHHALAPLHGDVHHTGLLQRHRAATWDS
jgi:hypothetical protein